MLHISNSLFLYLLYKNVLLHTFLVPSYHNVKEKLFSIQSKQIKK